MKVRQACAIPFRTSPLGGIEVLLVTTRGGGWGLPKGGIKQGHSAMRTASLESLEEAGVLGILLEDPVGAYSYRKQGKAHRVEVFALRVERLLERWEEEDRRVRVWVPIQEAPRLLSRRGLARSLTALRHRLLLEAQPPRLLSVAEPSGGLKVARSGKGASKSRVDVAPQLALSHKRAA